MDFVDADGRVLMAFEAEEQSAAEGWPRSFMFYQPDLERALRARVAELPAATVHLGHEVLTIAEQPDHVEVTVRDLRDGAFRDPKSYFHRYASLSDSEARATALRIWETINLVNLRENLLPTRPRADLVLRKGADHFVRSVFLRKL